MWIRVLSNTLVGGIWHEPGIGNYEPALAEHLIGLGVAEPYERKVLEVEETKVTLPKKITGSSQQVQASPAKTPKKRGSRRRKTTDAS